MDSRLKIVNTEGVGFKTKIFIDGEDVSSCFKEAKIGIAYDGAVEVELSPVLAEIEIDNVMQLKMPVDGTRELLVKHGWTPPVEPKVVKAVRTTFPYEPLDFGLVEDGESVGGVELLSRFFSRVQEEWEPNDADTLTMSRVYDDLGRSIPGKRKYLLEVTMDSAEEFARSDCE
jgi:hypothetical protein